MGTCCAEKGSKRRRRREGRRRSLVAPPSAMALSDQQPDPPESLIVTDTPPNHVQRHRPTGLEAEVGKRDGHPRAYGLGGHRAVITEELSVPRRVAASLFERVESGLDFLRELGLPFKWYGIPVLADELEPAFESFDLDVGTFAGHDLERHLPAELLPTRTALELERGDRFQPYRARHRGGHWNDLEPLPSVLVMDPLAERMAERILDDIREGGADVVGERRQIVKMLIDIIRVT